MGGHGGTLFGEGVEQGRGGPGSQEGGEGWASGVHRAGSEEALCASCDIQTSKGVKPVIFSCPFFIQDPLRGLLQDLIQDPLQGLLQDLIQDPLQGLLQDPPSLL